LRRVACKPLLARTDPLATLVILAHYFRPPIKCRSGASGLLA
jgi:hypothetical protein